MGAFSTLRHFDQLADSLALAECGNTYEVLTFDYRGIGKSSKLKMESQTSDMLANDTLELIRHVWGDQAVHIIGASMGGMVAQKLALKMLIPEKRLKSLYLAVTARNYGLARFFPLRPSLFRLMLPLAIPSDPTTMVKSLLTKCFSPEYLKTPHSETGEQMGELWLKRWVNEYEMWFSFTDIDASASQSTVAATHYLTSQEITLLKLSGVQISVFVAEGDSVMPPSAQHSLANMLGAEKYVTQGGHIGEFDINLQYTLQHLKKGS